MKEFEIAGHKCVQMEEGLGIIFDQESSSDEIIDLKVGMYVRTLYGIGKVDATEMFMGTYFQFHTDNNKGKIHNVTTNTYWNSDIDIIGDPADNLYDLLKEGDFIDGHLIVDIVDDTIYCADGWFLAFEDVEELVSDVLTKDQYERESYKIGEINNEEDKEL